MNLDGIDGASVILGLPPARADKRVRGSGEARPRFVDFVTLPSIQGGYVDREAIDHANRNRSLSPAVDDVYLTQAGDLVVGLTKPFSVAYVTSDAAGMLVPSSCAIIRLDETARRQLEPAYLAGYLMLDAVNAQLASRAGGARLNTLSVRTLSELDIPEISPKLQRELGRKTLAHIEASRLRRQLDMLDHDIVQASYADALCAGRQEARDE